MLFLCYKLAHTIFNVFFFFQAEDGIRDLTVTGVQTCALPIWSGRRTLVVVSGDDRLGLVNWRRRQTTAAGYCWQIGVIMRPEARGHGHGTRAHRLLAGYLFAHTPVHRIEAATEVGNFAEQKALDRAGFSREGVLRGIGWRDGAWRDGVGYSLLRTDPSAGQFRAAP